MSRGITYMVTVATGFKVAALNNVFWSQGQYVDIDPAFLYVCEELQQRIQQKALVLVSPNSEFRHGGPTGIVPSGDEMAALRRAAVARGRAPVVVNKIHVDRDQVIRDHLSGKLDLKAMAREAAEEIVRESSRDGLSDDDLSKIASRVADMLAGVLRPDSADEGRIAAKVAEMLLPAINKAVGSAPRATGGPKVIEVEMDSAPLPDAIPERGEVHIGKNFGQKSVGDAVDSQVADIEKLRKSHEEDGT